MTGRDLSVNYAQDHTIATNALHAPLAQVRRVHVRRKSARPTEFCVAVLVDLVPYRARNMRSHLVNGGHHETENHFRASSRAGR